MVKMLERWEERKVDRERKGRGVKKCIAFVSPICYYLFGIPSVHYLSSVCLIDICCLFPYLTFLSCFYSTCFLLCLVLLHCFICLLTYLPFINLRLWLWFAYIALSFVLFLLVLCCSVLF